MLQIQVSGLDCWRGERMVLRNLEMTAAAGEAVIVTGPNGAGKTTLLRAIAGLLRPARGTIALSGGDAELTLAEQCHFVSHRDAVKAALTVGENLQFWVTFYGGSPASGAADALAALGLDMLADLPARYLSAGQRRRLSLARLLAVRRPVWLLDEPTSALDADGQALLSTIVHHHLGAAGIIIATTHNSLAFGSVRTFELRGLA